VAPSLPSLNQTLCRMRQVAGTFPALPCPSCGHPADRTDTVARTAIDIDLDSPVLLHVTVSRHYCAPCRRYFRAQPPFLRPDAVYTNRVVAKAVQAVFHDGMAMRRVAARLARDFWVCPSEGSIRQWCREARTTAAFATEYEPWVVREFSGVLCVDEAYQGRVALLLAVDPAAPDGDRLVGYQLLTGSVRRADMEAFLLRLKAGGVSPDEVVTDGSPLYPSLVAQIWPAAAHQLCLFHFHETRRVTAAVGEVYRAVRKTLPQPPAAWTDDAPQGRGAQSRRSVLGGRPRTQPPAPESADPRDEQWRRRDALHQRGVAQVHALYHSGLSLRQVAAQTGFARNTVRAWIRQPAPDLDSVSVPVVAALAGGPPPRLGPPPPPAPWTSWAEVRDIREALTDSRFLLLRRPDHLDPEERAHLERVLASPIGAPLRIARAFLEGWYGLWRDAHGRRRRWDDAHDRYRAWQTNPLFWTVTPLTKVITLVDEARFTQLSHVLRNPLWEATNNGAERAGRRFRHLQGPHYNLRSVPSIERALAAQAMIAHTESSIVDVPKPSRSTRGRTPHAMPPLTLMAAA